MLEGKKQNSLVPFCTRNTDQDGGIVVKVNNDYNLLVIFFLSPVNNAGCCIMDMIDRKSLDICQSVMKKQKSGRILNVTSLAGFQSMFIIGKE